MLCLDHSESFSISQDKKDGYNRMIGNIDELTKPNHKLNRAVLNLPLPFYFSRYNDLSLPLKKNDRYTITYKFRSSRELLILKNKKTGEIKKIQYCHLKNIPIFNICETWGNFIICKDIEKKYDLIETFTN